MTQPHRWKVCCAVLVIALEIAAPAQTFTTLHSFNITDGEEPVAGLVQGLDGNLYGTTAGGGAYGYGTVFKITPSGTLTTLYSFCAKSNCADGRTPFGALVLASDGNFYGTTAAGGYYGGPCRYSGCGTLFRMTPGGSLSTLRAFLGNENGSGPSVLAQATNGLLYGTLSSGGTKGHGGIFRTNGSDKYTFWSLYPHGSDPTWLIQGTDENFYGVGQTSGTSGIYGSIFKMTPLGAFTTAHKFSGSDGERPDGLTQAVDGNFFGTTTYGGANNNSDCDNAGCGTVFEINPAGALTTLYSFCSQSNCADGILPVGVIQATDGNFYGVTAGGGAELWGGTIFQISVQGSLTTLYDFCPQGNCADGSDPAAVLLQATNGAFYGTTEHDGANNYYGGTIYSLSMGLAPFVAFVQKAGKIGQTAEILGQGFTGTTNVSFNGISANFTVQSETYLTATVPAGATTGYVTVTTPSGTLTSNVPFQVIR
jgi:uncharacterized repeat protein (TIGR03803 family)